MLLITATIGACLTLMFIKLSFTVIRLRRQHKVAFGDGGHQELERAIRVQGNFAEYVPLSLILMICLELNGAPGWVILLLGLMLIVGRGIHAMGLLYNPSNFAKRVLGMQLTFATLAGLVIANSVWVFLKLGAMS